MLKTFFLIFLSMMMGWALPLQANQPERPFQWIDDENYKPLIYRSKEGEARGLFHDVLTEAFKRMNMPLECKLYPWSRAQKMVWEKKGDGMVTVYTPRRQKFFLSTDPIVTVKEYVFTSKDNPKRDEILNARSIADLKRFVIVDTLGAGWSKENLKRMHVIWVPTARSAINMIATQRADLYLLNEYAGPYFIQEQIKKGGALQNELKKIVMGNYPITTMEYRLLIRRDSPYADIIERFNEILKQMHKDGTYQKFVKRYRIDMRYHPKQNIQ